MIVKPVFVSKKCQPNIDDFCTSIRYPGKMLIFGRFENSYPEECVKHEVILVSTNSKDKIENGESYYDGHGNIRVFGTGNTYNIDSRKIMVVQSQLLKSDILKLLTETEVEIEVETWSRCKAKNNQDIPMRKSERITFCNQCVDEIRPKLNDGFVTIIYKKELNNDEKIKMLCKKAVWDYIKNNMKGTDFNGGISTDFESYEETNIDVWFENNKHLIL